MVLGAKVPKYWVFGPSGKCSTSHTSESNVDSDLRTPKQPPTAPSTAYLGLYIAELLPIFRLLGYAYTYMRTYVCVHICVYIYTYMCMFMSLHVHTSLRLLGISQHKAQDTPSHGTYGIPLNIQRSSKVRAYLIPRPGCLSSFKPKNPRIEGLWASRYPRFRTQYLCTWRLWTLFEGVRARIGYVVFLY